MATLFQFPYRTVAEISLSALIRNLVTVRTLSRREVIPIVKADAYGHGMIPVTKALVGRGSTHTLAVATLEEAIEVRKKIPYAVSIIVLSGYWPHQLEAFGKYRLIPVIHSLSHLKSLGAGRQALPEIHLKLDTGMHRLGIQAEEIPEAKSILKRWDLKLSGIASHFAESEKSTSDFTDRQLEIFESMLQDFRAEGLLNTDAKIHVGNTAAVLRSRLGSSVAVRAGISLYGISPNPALKHSSDLIPILTWRARVVAVKTVRKGETVGYGRTYRAKKNEKIAIVSVGYADGYPRLASSDGECLIGGKRCALRGMVSMDLLAADCTGVDVKEGALVVLIGTQGKAQVSAWDIANWSRTIPYEITCGLSPRVPRVYLD